MATYDISPTARHHDLSAPAEPPEVEAVPGTSTLDDLRAAVEQVEQVVEHEFTDYELFSPGEIIRLTCSTDLDHNAWKTIQLASMPLAYRRKRIPDPRKIDEVVAYSTLIGQQVTEIAIRQSDDTYKPLNGTFDDLTVLGTFGVAEPGLAVRRVMGNDAYLLHAGRELIEACGLGERRPGEPGDDEDPT